MRNSFLPVLALVAALAVWVAIPVTGDDGDKPPKQPHGGGQGGGQGGPGGGMRMGGPMQPASICALGNALYVVRGSTIYKIDPETLQVIKKATYAEDEMPKPPKPPEGDGEGGPEDGGPGR